MQDAHCKACGAALVWLRHVRTGQIAPIETTPSTDGNLVREGKGQYRILPKAERATHVGPRYKNHFATCPEAARFGQQKGATA